MNHFFPCTIPHILLLHRHDSEFSFTPENECSQEESQWAGARQVYQDSNLEIYIISCEENNIRSLFFFS